MRLVINHLQVQLLRFVARALSENASHAHNVRGPLRHLNEDTQYTHLPDLSDFLNAAWTSSWFIILVVVSAIAVAALVVLALMRTLPRLLSLLEHISVNTLIAIRHLRATGSGFLTAMTLLSVFAVSVSSCSLTTTLSVMGGFRQDLKNKILGYHAHVTIDKADGATFGRDALSDKAFLRIPGVQAATPVLQAEIMISSLSNLSGALLRGIEPASARKVFDLARSMRLGTIDALDDSPTPQANTPDNLKDTTKKFSLKIRTGSRSHDETTPTRASSNDTGTIERTDYPGIILGQELARSLRVSQGDEVKVVSPNGDLGPTGPLPRTRNFRVVGIFYSGMYEYDMKTIYVAMREAQDFLKTGANVSRWDIRIKQAEQAPTIAQALRKHRSLSAFRVRDWRELNRTLFGALALEKLAMFVALGIAILVASFCIIGTLTLMIQEKRREVAVLMSLGASSKTISKIFMIEGVCVGWLGALIGIALSFVTCLAAQRFGVQMNPEIYYIDKLPVHMDATEFLLVSTAALAVAWVVTIYPAHLAGRLSPMEALRYE